jgi:hypothetical protein
MIDPLTKVLIKIFVKGFYRNHAGSLLFFFAGVFSYCFFIQVLNQTHLEPADRIVQNLLFVLTLLSSPPLVAIVFIVWIGFTFKSYRYIAAELILPANQFLFYSGTALKRQELFKSWFVVQTLISIPLLIFGLFALTVGAIYHQFTTAFVIVLFVILLNCLTSVFLTVRFYTHIESFQQSTFGKITQHWQKPFFSLFIYHIIDRPLALTLTKVLSFAGILSIGYLLPKNTNIAFVGGFIALFISVAHTFLVFESARFEREQLVFIKNFPWSKSRICVNWLSTLALILLPESLWLLLYFNWPGLVLVLYCAGICSFLRSCLYRNQLNMKKFLYSVFWVFTFSFIGLLFNLLLIMMLLALASSWILFNRFYYRTDWNGIILKS